MKIKSVSGITCYVKNLNKTAKFYETLGFEVRKRESDHITVYSNWFWMDFIAMDQEAAAVAKKASVRGEMGAGPFVYLSVDDVDAFHKYLLSKGLMASSKPRDRAGNREFVVRDPDGYELVIFRRK